MILMNKYSDRDNPEFLIIQFCIFLALSIPTRYYVKRYKSIAPFNLFLIVLVTIFATIAYSCGYPYKEIPVVDPYSVLSVFLPFFYASSMYDLDFYLFLRSIPQTIIIAWLGAFLNVIMMGMFFSYVLHPSWSIGKSIVSSMVFIPIQPSYVIVIFRELAHYNYLSTFVEAETVLSNLPVLICFKIGVIFYNSDDISVLMIALMFAKFLLGGIGLGMLSGKITATMMCWLYSEPYSALCVSVGIILITFYVLEYLLVCSGTVAIAVIMIFISYEKHKFSTEVDQSFRTFWKISSHLTQLSTLMYGTILILRHEFEYFELHHIYSTVIAYFTANICRIISFLLMGVILNKMAYEMNVRCLLVLAWGGVKGVMNILMALILVYNTDLDNEENCFLTDVAVYTFLSLMINSCSMRVTLQLIGFSQDSPMRKTNMSNCIKFIMDKRTNAINILKQDRYLMQANWSVVRDQTTMHYTRLKWNEEEIINNEENQEYLWKVSRYACAVCQSELPLSISQKDLEHVIVESQVKILKAKKVSIIKQYEKGNIDKNSLQSLLHMYDLMIDRSNQRIRAVNLKGYFKRKIWLEKVMNFLNVMTTHSIPEPPPTQFKRLCYYTMTHFCYDYIVFMFVLIYGAIIICYIVMGKGLWYDLCILVHIIFVLDFFIKVVGYSNRSSLFSLRLYLRRNKWNIFEFFFLLFGLLDYFITIKSNYGVLILVMKAVCLLRLLTFFFIIQPFYRYVLKVIEYRVDSRTCFGYDLATALEKCNDDILNVLHQIIGSKFMIDLFRKHLLNEKQMLIKQLEMVQKERPWIAITVKTKQAIRTTLNSMENTLNELKVAGFVDNVEYGFIWKEIVGRQKMLRNMRFIPPSSQLEIFQGVPWIAGEHIVDYLYSRAKLVRWEAGDLICREGESPCGIYIIINGMLRLYYTPKPATIANLKSFGSIPIVDNISATTIEQKCEINLSPGETLGLLSILTHKPYDCSIFAESDGVGFILTTDVINAAMEEDDNQIKGLEARMWKYSLIDLAVTILMDIPTYQSLTPAQIKYKLGSAFMPSLKCYKMFIITESMDEVLLMQGVVADYDNNHTFIAPMLIPRTVQKLILPTGSIADDFNILTKLLIVPTDGTEAFDIMEYEKEVAELVSNPSDSCFKKVATSVQKSAIDARRKSFFRTKT